jgi:hypothetical protein
MITPLLPKWIDPSIYGTQYDIKAVLMSMAGVEIVGRNGGPEINQAYFHKIYQNGNTQKEAGVPKRRNTAALTESNRDAEAPKPRHETRKRWHS